MSLSIIDYGAGNIFNLAKAFEQFNCKVKIIKSGKEVEKSDRLVIPGVGSFNDGIKNLKRKKLIESIRNYVEKDRPLLGICLGMQYLMNYSEENGIHKGLGIIDGKVTLFKRKPINLKIPHMGWNKLIYNKNSFFNDISKKSYFYFCHSFFVKPKNSKVILAKAKYGENLFCAALMSKNIIGCQFHPERSGREGLKILENFLKI